MLTERQAWFLDKSVNYLEFIDSIKAETLTFSQYLNDPDSKNRKILLLRHDIDKNVSKALYMAKAEAREGIKATYFFAHRASYFKTSKFIHQAKKIQRLGHEVGLHSDAYSVFQETGIPFNEILSPPLAYLRSNGLDVKGVSSHKYRACQIWKEFDPQKNQLDINETIKRISLRSLGLNYEAYFIHPDIYLSDSGGKWGGIVLSKDDLMPPEGEIRKQKCKQTNHGLDVINIFREMSKGVMSFCCHPQHWIRVL